MCDAQRVGNRPPVRLAAELKNVIATQKQERFTLTTAVPKPPGQRSALLVAGAATRPAQGIAPLTQLWPAPSQLQAPPTLDAAALEAQARRDRALPGGRATARHTADPERTPQVAVPLLRLGDGDRASAHRRIAIARWPGGATRCAMRGTPHSLNEQTTRTHHRPPTCPRVRWQLSFKKPPFAPSRLCNEGGRGQQRRLHQPICAARPSASARFLRDVSCVGHCHSNPGSSNNRIRSRLRAIYP